MAIKSVVYVGLQRAVGPTVQRVQQKIALQIILICAW